MTRSAFLAVLCLALAGCAAIDPYNMMGRRFPPGGSPGASPVPQPTGNQLSAEERQRAFDFVWTTIRDRYYDANLNGVDWAAAGARFRPQALEAKDDDAFWDALDRLTGELKDAHTRVESPKRAELLRRDESVSLGFSFLPLEGKLAVSLVNPDSDAWWAGVRPGMALVQIGTEPALGAYERLKAETRNDSTERSRHMRVVRRLMTGEPDTQASFTFERADGTRLEAAFKRRRSTTAATHIRRVLPSGYGYIRFTQWSGGVLSGVVDSVKELRKTPGIIVDVRGNPGGSLFVVNRVLESFFAKKTELGRSLTRTGKPVAFLFDTVEVIKLKQTIDGSDDAYAGPVVVLVNEGSGSGSEYFAGAMQALGRAKVVGRPTCGCLLGYLGYAAIPGGGELAYSEVGFEMANGKRIEGEGVIPDKVVPLTINDLTLNRDRALEEAQELLKTMKGPATPDSRG
jgi:carboxyl-terminal processing protease